MQISQKTFKLIPMHGLAGFFQIGDSVGKVLTQI
jgi:hypothetical protein